MIKNLLLLTLFFGLIFTSTFAQTDGSNCASSPEPVTINNGGAPLTIIGKGNQYNSWTETIDGFLVKQNTHYEFEYVQKDTNGKLEPSGMLATNSSLLTKSKNSFIKADKQVINQLLKQNAIEVEAIEGLSSAVSSIAVFTNTAMPTTGSIKVLCLLVDYPNMANSYSKTDFENLLNQPNYNGTGSLKDYFLQSSFGKLDVTVDVIDWVTAPNDYEYYGNSNGYGVARELVRFAVDQAELNGIDFSQYDNDNDGDVDGIMVVHAGQGAEEGAQRQYIWSHRSRIAPVTYDGKTISDYIMNPETRASGTIATVGVYCHEFGHNLGLPDLYDTDGSSQGIGNWGLMGSSAWLGGGKRPGGLSAWSKVKLGWQVPTEITLNGSYVLNPADATEEIYLLDPGEGKEFFLLENRQKEGVDQALPGSGLAIWHIDDARYTNSFEAHKRVDVEEADGLNGLDGSSRGDAGDLYPGTSGNTVFNAVSNPNNQLYGGSINPARIVNIVQNADKTISFDVDFDNIKFSPYDTIAFQPTATGQSKEKSFSLKAYNYDFTVTSVTYPDGFSGTLTAGEVIPLSTQSEFSVFFNPMSAKNYKDNIAIEGVSNGVTISGKVKVKGVGLQLLFADNFETNKGWGLNGFERGAPQGLANDPAAAFEGVNVLGNVLGGTGNYDNNLADREWTATSPSFSSFGYSNIQLNFQQWLNLSNYDQDFAYLDVSIDGGITWKQILFYGDWEIFQTDWWKISRDISDYIAWEKDVQLRFSLGKTDASNVNGGWNIDDLLITGEAEEYELAGQLNFGVTGIGINKTRTLTLKNGTLDNFIITNINLPSGYSTSFVVGDVIVAGLQSNFDILFSPELKQAYDGLFTIEFTDGTTSFSETLPIKGNGDYLIFEDDFETDKGWILAGGFEVGAPLGRGYDPFYAVSGETVLGTVLAGNGQYQNNLIDREWSAASPIIDCSAFTNVALNFAQYNQIDGSYDSAYVDVSIDAGITWSKVWSTEGRWVGNWQWENTSIDISALADGQANVMVRFSLGVTDSNWTYAGWNIDDISLSGDTDVAIEVTELVNYGDVILSSSTANDIIIKNVGIQDLVITNIDYPTDFSGENYTGTLASGATKTISVSFNPTEIKDYQDTLKVVSNAATGNYYAVFTGLGQGAQIRVRNTMAFGDVFVDSTSVHSIYVVNEGNKDLNVTGINHGNIAFSGSWSGIINPNDSVEVIISFTPTDAVGYSNTMTVSSDAVVGTGSASFTGTGILPIRSISLDRTIIDFGNVTTGLTSTEGIFIKNEGNVDLTVSGVTHSNTAFSGSWSGVINPNDSVKVNLEFAPSSAGDFTDNLAIMSDALSGTSTAQLNGFGVANISKIGLSSVFIEFDSVRMDSTGLKDLYIKNEGNVDLTVSGVTHSNTAFSGSWSGVINPNDSVKVNLEFAPGSAGDFTDSLTIMSDVLSGTSTAQLNGFGVANSSKIQLSEEMIEFDVIRVSTEGYATLEVKNLGNISLEISSVETSNTAFKVNWTSAIIEPESSKELVLTFLPIERLNYSSSLKIMSNSEFGDVEIPLSGEGIAAEIALSGNLNFGEVEIEKRVTDTLYIANIGNASLEIEEIQFSNPSLTGDYAGILNAGEIKPVLISFTPTEAKPYEMDLQVMHNAEFGMDTLAINGVGVDIIAGLSNAMDGLSIYPNPTSGIVSVLTIGNLEASYLVINDLGKVLLKGTLLKEIDLSRLPNGIYTIRISSKNNGKMLKVVLQR